MRTALVFAAGLAFTGPAAAQDADWDVTGDPATGLTLVSLDYGANVLAFRCQNKVFDFILTGTPPADVDRRVVTVSAGRISTERQTWLTQPNMPHLSPPEPDLWG